jgi:hypothetical protein
VLPPEPVSPELVLVDPELAERERARLVEKARLETLNIQMLRRAVERDLASYEGEPDPGAQREPGAFVRGKLVPVVLSCSLFANGVFAAVLATRADSHEAAAGVSPVTVTVAAGPVTTQAEIHPPLLEKSIVERKLASLILKAPGRKLPRAFVDPVTGLVRNNVFVVCRRAQRHSYLCTVGVAGSSAGVLRVRYRRGAHGKELFNWYGFKRNAGAGRPTAKS